MLFWLFFNILRYIDFIFICDKECKIFFKNLKLIFFRFVWIHTDRYRNILFILVVDELFHLSGILNRQYFERTCFRLDLIIFIKLNQHFLLKLRETFDIKWQNIIWEFLAQWSIYLEWLGIQSWISSFPLNVENVFKNLFLFFFGCLR